MAKRTRPRDKYDLPEDREWHVLDGEYLSKNVVDRIAKVAADNDYCLSAETLAERFGTNDRSVRKALQKHRVYDKYLAKQKLLEWKHKDYKFTKGRLY